MFHGYVLTFGGKANVGYVKDNLMATAGSMTPKQIVVELLRPGLFALVGMFFGLSGFLVAGSALRSRNLRVFFTLRVLRILPALFTETALSALILGPLVTTSELGAYFSDPALIGYFGNMVGDIHYQLPGVFKANPLPGLVNANLWTLPAEFYCYILMGIMMLTGLLYRPRLLTTVCVCALAAALVVTKLALFGVATRWDTTRFKVWFLVLMFTLGVLFNVHAARIPINRRLFLACGAGYFALMILGVADVIASVLLTYCMVYLGMQRFTWFDRLVKDDWSYGVYLYGYPITQTVVLVLVSYFGTFTGPAHMLIVIATSVALTVLFALFSWRCIEKPALALKKRLLPARPTMVAAE